MIDRSRESIRQSLSRRVEVRESCDRGEFSCALYTACRDV